MMRVIVCGGRDYANSKALAAVLDAFHAENKISLLVQGGQREWQQDRWVGADWLASEWARWREVAFVNEPARWTQEGKKAGPIRNAWMLRNWSPDRVIAFPGGRGTADMVKCAKAAGVEVVEVERS